MNDEGQAVGFATLPGEATFHATLWTQVGKMTDLGTLGNDPCSYATGINAGGQVVGASIASTDCKSIFHAFLWEDGSLFDMNALISAGSSLSLTQTYTINNRGEIAGEGRDGSGHDHAILLIPWAIPYVADGLMWKWIYDSGYGALNGLLLQLGFIDKYMVWLGDTHKTLALISNAFVWKEVPLATILLLVTMKSISPDLYAAARVDGAGLWHRFVHVTLPSMRPGFMLVMIYEAMMAVRHFDLFFILTEGGPADASHVVSWHIYVETFRNLSFGSGAAVAYVLALATFAMSYAIIRLLGKRL